MAVLVLGRPFGMHFECTAFIITKAVLYTELYMTGSEMGIEYKCIP
jgi:hypothetical protein